MFYDISLWICYRDEVNYDENDSDNESDDNDNSNNDRINSNKTIPSKSFQYKVKVRGSTPNNSNTSEAEFLFSLN